MKVAELEGAKLDRWVAVGLVGDKICYPGRFPAHEIGLDLGPNEDQYYGDDFTPSTRWDHAGPIMERESIGIGRKWGGAKEWCAWIDVTFNENAMPHDMAGSTPLIAAMRAYVASKFGDTVDDFCPKSLDSRKSQQ